MTAKEFLLEKIQEEILLYFPSLSKVDNNFIETLVERWSNDSLSSEQTRFADLSKYAGLSQDKQVLDMSSGCGSFVIQGLLKGYDINGIEPEAWKQELIDLKFKENNYPSEWRERIANGIGEQLPFENEAFDVFNSWQTFEHVQDVSLCLSELYRVLKKQGAGIITCPNYMTFYEGHYKMFWFPMMGNSAFAKFYLKICGRPADGLRTFVPINARQLSRKAKEAGFTVVNIVRQEIYDAVERRFPSLVKGMGFIVLPTVYSLWRMKRHLTSLGKNPEIPVQLLLKKP